MSNSKLQAESFSSLSFSPLSFTVSVVFHTLPTNVGERIGSGAGVGKKVGTNAFRRQLRKHRRY